jgi:hypothetical protein
LGFGVADWFDGYAASGALLAFLFPDFERLAITAEGRVFYFVWLAVEHCFVVEAAKEDRDLAVFYEDCGLADGFAGAAGLVLYLAEGVKVIVCGFFFHLTEAG